MDLTYLTQGGDTDFKIGHSLDILGRKSTLQTGNPVLLSLVVAVEGGRALEDYLHETFKEYRNIREWFIFPDREIARQMFLEASDEYWILRAKHPSLKSKMLVQMARAKARLA